MSQGSCSVSFAEGSQMKFTFETFEILFDRFMFHEPIKRERFAGPITNRLFSFSLFCPKRTFR